MPLLRHSSSGDLCGCFPQPFTDRIAIIHGDADVSVSHGALLHRDWCAQFVQPREVAVPKAVWRNVLDTHILTRSSQLLPK